MSKSCSQKTRYIAGVLVPSHTAYYDGRTVVYGAAADAGAEISIENLPDGAELTIPADPTLGAPEVTLTLDTKATLGRRGRRSFSEALAQRTDPSDRAAFLAVALGGLQSKLDKTGKYGSEVMRAIYDEAGISHQGRSMTVDEHLHAEHYRAFETIIASSAADPALRRAAMAVSLQHPTFGYLGTATGAEEAYQADRMERDIARVQTETELAAAAMHDAWRAPRLLPDGTFEPRLKDDGQGGQVDIANTTYGDLPAQWQAENHAAATAVVRAIEADPGADIEALADVVHQDWLSRNAEWAEPTQLLPYADLPEAEKQKDREVVLTALAARTAAEVEAARAWVADEDMRFFDGIAGFQQTQDLALVAFDSNLPQEVRQAASDRVMTSPYLTTGSLETLLAGAPVPADDPVRLNLTERIAERERLSNERLRRVFAPTPAARGAHLMRSDGSDTPTPRPGRLS